MRLHRIVSAGQAGDGIEQDDHVTLVLDHAFGLFADHFGDLHVPFRRLVECGADDFGPAATAFHVGDFLGSFVNEQDEQVGLGVVF